MEIAILILVSIIWLADLIEAFKCEDNGILFTAALATLLYWQICLPISIIIICISFIAIIYHVAND